jgi:pSer/pThr/pTyr-binding forkhead associated (FHA) protein
MQAKLRVIAGSVPFETIQVSPGKLLVGRAEDCDVQVTSEFVSGHHCVLLTDEYALRIRDLGSKNGTIVNGRRIGTAPTILLHDDIVSLGDIYFLVDLRPVSVTAAAPETKSKPAVAPTALQGTGIYNGDTLEAELPDRPPPQAAPPPVPSAGDPTPLPPTAVPNPQE